MLSHDSSSVQAEIGQRFWANLPVVVISPESAGDCGPNHRESKVAADAAQTGTCNLAKYAGDAEQALALFQVSRKSQT